MPPGRRAMFDGDSTIPNRASLFLPVLALAAAGIAVIVLSGSLGAATSGRSFLSQKSGAWGQASNDPGRTSDLPEVLIRSGA